MSKQTHVEYPRVKKKSDVMLYAACFFLSLIILVVDLQIPLGVAGGVPYIAVVLISLWSSSKNFTIVVAITCSVLTVIGFFFSPEGGVLWQVLFNRFLALFAIWVTALLSLKIKCDSLEQIKVLKGLLPICASCKKIRDDNGYWSQIESYIHENSEAEFSHGICPDCFRELYPDIEPETKP